MRPLAQKLRNFPRRGKKKVMQKNSKKKLFLDGKQFVKNTRIEIIVHCYISLESSGEYLEFSGFKRPECFII